MSPRTRSVTLVTLGCARNEVDSEELAGRLAAGGWRVNEPGEADVVLVNTCGFIDAAKKDSIDTVLAAADGGTPVVATGCLAERYGEHLARELPEAAAVLGFDSYEHITERLEDVLAGRAVPSHQPRDRRTLLPLAPSQRPEAARDIALPGHSWLPSARRRLGATPLAYLKLASGCDRRCSFCAIPSFRGSFVSRPPADLVAEARWLAGTGARELVLVSENSTSYGKDLGDLRALERLLPQLAGIDGVERVRISYLQPAEMRDSLIDVITQTPGVADYFDLSFQHASPSVLRAMRRFGGTGAFLDLLERIRAAAPDAGVRSNVIVGFPGETDGDLAELEDFLTRARLDAIGVFGYSAEEGTDATALPGQHLPDLIARRVERVSALADELMVQRAEDRIGSSVEVLVESDGAHPTGRGSHQGPDGDGCTRLEGVAARPGQLVAAVVTGCDGVDLLAHGSGQPW